MAAISAFLVLAFLLNVLYCAEYYVKPENSSTTCPSQPCRTLSEYLQDPTTYFTSGSTFTLLQGQHLLNQTMALSNVTGITLRGVGERTLLYIEKWGNFTCYDCTIEIRSLEIQYSGTDEFSYFTALTASRSALQFLEVTFTGENSKFSQGIQLFCTKAKFKNCSFANWNTSAIQINATSNVSFSGCTNFTNNKVGGYFDEVLFGNNSHITMYGHITFSNNGACVVLRNCTFTSYGKVKFLNNTSTNYNSVVDAINSNLTFSGEVGFLSNIDDVAAWNSFILFEGEIIFIGNTVKKSSYFSSNGGAIAIYRSTMKCIGNITFANNFATGKGGAVYALNSIITITGIFNFVENTAVEGGGAIALENRPPPFVFTTYVIKHSTLVLSSPVVVNFERNEATSKGEALLFVDFDSNTRCNAPYISCFLAVESQTSDILMNFEQNQTSTGAVLYGPLKKQGGTCAEIDGHHATGVSLQLFYTLSNISEKDNQLISSDPVKLSICNGEDIVRNQLIYADRGKTFTVAVMAIGQHNDPVASTIYAYIKNDDQSELAPQSYSIEGMCTNITFRLNARHDTNTLVLQTDGPCRHIPTEVPVILRKCPLAFNLNRIHCTCNEILKNLSEIVTCDNDNLLIHRQENSWIDSVLGNHFAELVFIYHQYCPQGYCNPKRKVVSFSENSSSALCSSNRTGLLCGACKEGFSLTLNSFNCKECSNNYISLLLFFGFSGIVLVVMLLALHMTVAAGTINGLILYANIVNANSLIFFTQNNTKVLTKIFTAVVSWLNLDLGIETCFYDGLDFYSYAWLQYAFPFYLWFVIGIIVLINKFSTRAGKLFGSNPVAVLATVILVSFTKLLQASILALSYTPLHFSNETMARVVWLHDANITYFHGKHVIICIMAICVIALLLVPYLFLLLFGYRLQEFSRKRAFWWLNRFKPLLDAYYAPYHQKMRFWPGLMLLVRGSLFMVTALSSNSNWTLITIAFAFTGLVSVPWLGHRVYEKLYNDILEGSFIFNILLLSIATLYVKLSGGRQDVVIGLSISIVLLQFIGIVFFHFCLVLKKSKVKVIAKLLFKSAAKKPSSSSVVGQASIQEISCTTIELREPLLDSTK